MEKQKEIQEKIIKELYNHTPKNIGLYKYFANKENESKIVDQILEAYRKIDPQHASLESAFQMYKVIHKIALIKQKSSK